MTPPKIHRATPADEFAQDAASVCIHCHRDIKRVPGGHGPTWVHTDSGAVVGTGTMKPITRDQAADMADAHAEGLHAELPREGCPECEDRPLSDYPRAGEVTGDGVSGLAPRGMRDYAP